MSIKEIVMHVGMHKTGTTSVQRTIFHEQNKKILFENGYFYPSMWDINMHTILYSLFCDDPVTYFWNSIKGYQTREEIESAYSKYLENLIVESRNTECDKLLIIGEEISRLNENNLTNLKKYLIKYFGNVCFRIIIYVREPTSYFVSMVQQNISDGATFYNALDFHERGMGNLFRSYIEKFIRVFGNGVKVFKFENSLNTPNRGIVEHFLKILGLNENEISKFQIIKTNEARCGEVIELMSYFNERVPMIINTTQGLKVNPLREDSHLLNILEMFNCPPPLFKVKGTKFDLPYEKKIKIKEISEKDMKWLKDYFEIDYTNFSIEIKDIYLEYSEDTIISLIEAFPKLTNLMKKLFLSFFEQKYLETGDEKFKSLCDVDMLIGIIDQLEQSNSQLELSIKNLKDNNAALISSTCWKITKPLRKISAVLKFDRTKKGDSL